MAIKLIRADGREVQANEDAIGFDFSFGGQAGFIKDYLNEFDNDVSVSNVFSVKTGMGVVQGVQFSIETTENVALQTAVAGLTYWYILYAEINMGASETIEEVEVQGLVTLKTDSLTNAYPQFPVSDNLKSQPNGKVYLPLYRFKQTTAGVVEIEKVVKVIDYFYKTGDKVSDSSKINNINLRNESNVLKADDYVVEKRKLLFNGVKNAIFSTDRYVFNFDFNFEPNKNYEILFKKSTATENFIPDDILINIKYFSSADLGKTTTINIINKYSFLHGGTYRFGEFITVGLIFNNAQSLRTFFDSAFFKVYERNGNAVTTYVLDFTAAGNPYYYINKVYEIIQ